jgi:hypothetical protein
VSDRYKIDHNRHRHSPSDFFKPLKLKVPLRVTLPLNLWFYVRFSSGWRAKLLILWMHKVLATHRAGRGIPKLAQGLRGVAEPHPLPDERVKGMADRRVLRIIALADTQQDIAVKQTGLADRHQS